MATQQYTEPTAVLTLTAWQSVPKFIRFMVWLSAILTLVGLILGVLFGILGVALGIGTMQDFS